MLNEQSKCEVEVSYSMTEVEVPYIMAEVPGKGRGLFATRTLDVGEIVVIEKPLVVIQSSDNEDIMEVLMNLPPDIKTKMMQMSDQGEADTNLSDFLSALMLTDQAPMLAETDMKVLVEMMKKFRANMYGAPGLGDWTAVFPIICLINHSCSPNVLIVDHQDEESLEVRVCRRIIEGQEILISYYIFAGFPLRQERMEMIAEDRFFQCMCELCALSGENLSEDENIRGEIRRLDKEMEEDDLSEALEMEKAEQKLELMDKIEDSVILRFPEHLVSCYKLAESDNQVSKMVKYKERGLSLAIALGTNYHNFYIEQFSSM